MVGVQDKFHLSLDENIFLAKKILVGSIYSEAKIEGVVATYPETQTILDGVNVPSAGLNDITVILNLRDGWRFLLSDIKDITIDLEFIMKINENVSRNESLDWGKLRTGQIGIAGTDHKPAVPDATQVRDELTKITDDMACSAAEKALDLMLFIMNAQLFWDGNKRTATLVANAVLIQNGAGVLCVPETKIGRFNQLLTDFYNSADGEKLKQFLYQDCIVGIDKTERKEV
jgi:Fic family protein